MLWDFGDFKSMFIYSKTETWLSARLQQCLGKQAIGIVKSQHKKKKKTKPCFDKDCILLDSRFVDIKHNQNSFDMWIKLSSIGNRIILKLPGRKHKQFNKFDSTWGLLKAVRLRKANGHYYIDLFFSKEEPAKREVGNSIGIDIGYKKLIVVSDGRQSGDMVSIYEKLSRRKHGSKAFKKSLTERNQTINREINKLDFSITKEIVVENLKNVKRGTKGKIRKVFMNKLQRWSYLRVFDKLSRVCEESGIDFIRVNPAYTSQTCNKCGLVDKKSRNGEKFLCTGCGMSMDADFNAAINILHRGVYSLSTVGTVNECL